ncbi:arginase family protein [Marinitenerispora sediminis]|uniref:Arginase n=1 Tax=Marinitenerispora sediminis TaxID=1931232 RepID=A0A368TEW1_9ACTN|nr:arginase family protein [Marinitenerispora sediminis]RCV57966.1 arginase [Marinitenerispora sediminis]RCV62301.1 arginase [Marinitenerispora sediminis]RCV62567.1 arginase [Marinitenerispora sediminis]
MIDLIVSQGRVADRAARMIEGAAQTARALEHRYGLTGRYVGKAAPPADDDWSVSLPQARETLVQLGRAVAASVQGGNRTAMIANTCSASLASLPVVAREHPDAVVLYVDAHGDFNTPDTTETGYLGGMVLAAACGLWDSGHGAGLRPEQAVLVGARDIDGAEHELLRKAGVRVIPPAEATPENVADAVNGSPVWIHVDWDVLDPGSSVPADYQVPDGMSEAQIRALFESVPPERLLGVELAEFNAPADDGSSRKAVSAILDMVAPVFEPARAG